MKDFGTVKSAVRPEPMVVDDFSVWIHNDIQETETPGMEEGTVEHGFQFHMIQYSKDEYIKLMAEQNATLEQQLTDTQLALCDVYELLES